MIQDIAPHKFHNEYQPQTPQENSRILYYKGKEVLTKNENQLMTFPRLADLEKENNDLASQCRYLFAVDSEPYFLVDSLTLPDAAEFSMTNVSVFRKDNPDYLDFAGITGFQLYNWYQNRRYCGRCAKPMIHSGNERMVRCPECGLMEYPKISPAIIVGITNGDKLLMSPYTDHCGRKNYALFAGFAEIGETIEETVQREVMEEVGLHVKNIRFYKSQPWSFTDCLLMGFYCDLDGSDKVKVDHKEVEWAKWFDRRDIPVECDGLSLTNEMIVHFKESGSV